MHTSYVRKIGIATAFFAYMSAFLAMPALAQETTTIPFTSPISSDKTTPCLIGDPTIQYHADTPDIHRSTNNMRIAMYVAQAADSFVTGSAVKHGAIGRTMFGTTNTATYLASSAVFDVILGAFTRRASDRTKNTISFGLGASAFMNATQDRGRQ